MTPTVAELQAWLVERVGRFTGLPPDEIDPRAPVARFGLDSVALITMAGELEERYEVRFRENPFDDTPTIEGLSRFLAEQVSRCQPPRSE